MFFSLQSFGRTYPFGGLPGQEEPYGFCSVGAEGALYTVVNPSQSVRRVKLPRVHVRQSVPSAGRVQFCDAGFKPVLSRDEILLGPEQLVLVGFGEFSKTKYDLGVQDDVVIPKSIRPVPGLFHADGTNASVATISAPAKGSLRIVMRQWADGKPARISVGAPPNGTTLGKLLQIEVSQSGHPVPTHINYDKALWSGLSWAVAEVAASDLTPEAPLTIRCVAHQTESLEIRVGLYLADY
jgi:hypothetical protein